MTAAPPPLPAPAQKSLAQQIRRWVVGVIIVSFAIAALGGIIVLLSGSWSDTAGKVLGTTALTGLFSVAVLCGVALVGRSAQWFGWITVGVSIATLVRLLWLIWAEPSWSDHSFELTVTMCILTAALAVGSLLMLLSAHNRTVVRVLLYITLGFIALGVILTLLAVWQLTPEDSENYWRGTGVVWILAALGIVIVPVMSLLMRTPQTAPAPPQHYQPPTQDAAASTPTQATAAAPALAPDSASTHAPEAAPAFSLSPQSVERIAVAARGAGISPDELIDRLLPPR